MKFKKFISSSLAIGLLLNSTSISLASILSEDGRYETFEGSNITIPDVLEEDRVDVEIEGNTMVNVANQKDPVPITKSYTVEGANHIPLQGEYDGKARPVIEGNTLVNLLDLNLRDREATASNPTSIDSKNKEISWDWSIGQVYNNWIQIDNKLNMAQPNKTYTLIANIKQNNPMLDGELINLDIHGQVWIPNCGVISVDIPNGKTGIYKKSFTTTEDTSRQLNRVGWDVHSKDSNGNILINGGKLIIGDIMLLEGDWTNKEVPKYFEGLKSSFEDQLVTQEMVDNGKEKAENLGKYKIECKMTGKNKFDISKYTSGQKLYVQLKPNTQYRISGLVKRDSNYVGKIFYSILHDATGRLTPANHFIFHCNLDINYNHNFTTDNTGLVWFETYGYDADYIKYLNIQIEEGSVMTEYEPYKESVKTFYLNSPLLKGDTIEDINGKATHVKRNNQVVLDGSTNLNAHVTPNSINDTNRKTLWAILDRKLFPDRGHTFISNKFKSVSYIDDVEGIGFGSNVDLMIEKSKLISLDNAGLSDYFSKNPTTIVYRLVNPIYETISEESILCESYASGHLDLNSNIPVNKVDFIPTNTNLNYLYPSTEYTVQFESDNKGKIDEVLLGDEVLYSNYTVNKGINKFDITTPDEILSTELIFNGIGFNLSNLVVTQATDESFDYFEGIKSVGQDDINGHSIEVISSSLDKNSSNKVKVELNEPLRGLSDEVKDRIIKRDGRWMIERNCTEIILDSKKQWNYHDYSNDDYIFVYTGNSSYDNRKERTNIISNIFGTYHGSAEELKKENYEYLWIGNQHKEASWVYIDRERLLPYGVSKESSRNDWIIAYKKWLSENKVRVIYQLEEPVYEPLSADLSLNTYLDTTHISTNSNIPANLKITVDRVANRAKEYSELAKENPTIENISLARMWTNKMRESILKDEFQDSVDSITEITDMTLDRKTASSNLDVYVKSQNMLSMSLDTNSITFDGYSGVEDMEKLGAVNISINSSLPYSLNAYMPSEMTNSDKSEVLPIDTLNIRENSVGIYQTFDNTTDKVILKDNCSNGNGLVHNIDFKLSSNQAHKADVYKTVIKFEAEQK